MSGRLISPSSLLTHEKCPARWKYGKDEEDGLLFGIGVNNIAARLGSNFHENIIPEYFNTVPDKPTAEQVEKFARDAYDTAFDPSLGAVAQNAQSILKNFIIFEKGRAAKWKQYKPDFIEKRLSNKEFLGIIDFYCDGVIIDWKTGFVSSITEDFLVQGGVYRFILEDNQLVVRKVIFSLIGAGNSVEVPAVTRGWLQAKRQRMIEMIESGDFRATLNEYCRHCPYILRCPLWNKGRNLWY